MKKVRGSFTLEVTIIVPLILFIFGVLLHILFYWHDKNILMSTAHETAALGSSRSNMAESELEQYFFSRMQGKLLIFNHVECTSYIEEDRVIIVWDGSKDSMVAEGEISISRTEPENYIREIQKLKKLGEGIGKQD